MRLDLGVHSSYIRSDKILARQLPTEVMNVDSH